MPELSMQVTTLLDSMARFDGHNGFVSYAGKEHSVQLLRVLAGLPDRPTPGVVEEYLRGLDQVSKMHDGAARGRQLYAEVLAGKRHRVGNKAIADRPLSWDPERQTWHLPGR